MEPEFHAIVSSYLKRRRGFVIATVVETLGSSSAKVGSKALIDEHGDLICGWVGGGCAESAVRQTAVECLETGRGVIIDIDLNEEILGVGMPCGGSMRVFVDPVTPSPTMWILGQGGITEELCRLAKAVGFSVIINDTDANASKYPDATKIINDDRDYTAMKPAKEDVAVVATQHKGDHDSMKKLLKSPIVYIALIASHKRSGLVLDYLRAAGFGEDDLARVNAPAGLEIGATTPAEIAVSIVTQIIAFRNGVARVGMNTGLLNS